MIRKVIILHTICVGFVASQMYGQQKTPGTYGTLDALLHIDSLLIVQGTRGFNSEKLVLDKWAAELEKLFSKRGVNISIVADIALSA